MGDSTLFSWLQGSLCREIQDQYGMGFSLNIKVCRCLYVGDIVEI